MFQSGRCRGRGPSPPSASKLRPALSLAVTIGCTSAGTFASTRGNQSGWAVNARYAFCCSQPRRGRSAGRVVGARRARSTCFSDAAVAAGVLGTGVSAGPFAAGALLRALVPPAHATATATTSTSAARRTDSGQPAGSAVVGDDRSARGRPRLQPTVEVHGLEAHLAQLDGGVGAPFALAGHRDEPPVHGQGEALGFELVERDRPRVRRVSGPELAGIADVHEHVVG